MVVGVHYECLGVPCALRAPTPTTSWCWMVDGGWFAHGDWLPAYDKEVWHFDPPLPLVDALESSPSMFHPSRPLQRARSATFGRYRVRGQSLRSYCRKTLSWKRPALPTSSTRV